MYSLDLRDGSGSAQAPTGNVYLRLAGSCNFRYLKMSNRSECIIYNNDQTPTVLKIETMDGGKVTLNDSSNNPSDDISGLLTDHIFLSGNGSWYSITGSSIFGG